MKCVKFECDNDLTKYVDSMLFDSTSDTGESIAHGIFEHDGEQCNIWLDVRGEVSVTYKGTVYHRPSEFPEELIEKIRKNPNDWEYNGDDDIYVGLNNWFEYIFESDGEVYEADLSKATPEMIKEDMEAIACQYFET